MNKHVGRKIKTLANVIMWIQIILFSLGGIAMIVMSASRGGSQTALGILIGIGIIVVGVLIAWISSWMLYGYGQLIDSTQNIEEFLKGSGAPQAAQPSYSAPAQNYAPQRPVQPAAQSGGFYFCTNCGAKVPSNQPVCPSCGHSR